MQYVLDDRYSLYGAADRTEVRKAFPAPSENFRRYSTGMDVESGSFCGSDCICGGFLSADKFS